MSTFYQVRLLQLGKYRWSVWVEGFDWTDSRGKLREFLCADLAIDRLRLERPALWLKHVRVSVEGD